jgi:molybdate transport system substrate-binding protein
MRNRFLVAFLFFLLSASVAQASSATIAAAASLKPVLEALASSFQKQNAGDDVAFVFGSSGKLFAQIKEGAPFEAYFSADMDFPRKLVFDRFASGEARVFAKGKLAFWTSLKNERLLKSHDAQSFDFLAQPPVVRIAIANPKLAPYGARAEEVLRSVGLFEKVKSKIVFGQDVAQVAQFAHTGNVQAAFLPLSLVLASELSAQGRFVEVSSSLYGVLEQGFVLTKRGAENRVAKRFVDYVTTAEAQVILEKFGFLSVTRVKPGLDKQSK